MAESIAPNVIHDKRMPNVVVGVPIVELADVERIQGPDDVHIAIGIQAEGALRELLEISSNAWLCV